MQTASRSRFVASLTLFSVGWLSMLFKGQWPHFVTPLCFTVAFLVDLSPAERQRALPPRELLQMGAFLGAFILVVVATKVWVPEPTNDRMEAVFRSPWFVIPTWIVFLGLALFVRKKRQRAGLTGDQAAINPPG